MKYIVWGHANSWTVHQMIDNGRIKRVSRWYQRRERAVAECARIEASEQRQMRRAA